MPEAIAAATRCILSSTDDRESRLPCLILAIAEIEEGLGVYVQPVTRTPQSSDTSIELSHQVRRKLGLDTRNPSWLVTNEINFLRRGSDVVPVAPGVEHYGRLADKRGVRENHRQRVVLSDLHRRE